MVGSGIAEAEHEVEMFINSKPVVEQSRAVRKKNRSSNLGVITSSHPHPQMESASSVLGRFFH